ncbi:hypothetical protein C8R44DRAFT_865716 [Mycena epipterygia]|nr:hypothetical protein C8R44DRAFT_865716 [Mycena epipterygia]
MSTVPSPSASAAVALPTGCSSSDFPGPGSSVPASKSFLGCTAGVASVLVSCCATVGGTAAFVDNTCGCPFDASFLAANEQDFEDCALASNTTSACSLGGSQGTAQGGPSTSAGVPGMPLRWNAATVVLGLALLVGLVG